MPFARRFMLAACGNSSHLSSVRGLAKVKTKSLYTHVIRTLSYAFIPPLR